MSNLASSEMRKISVPSKTTEEVKDPSEVLADNQKLLAEIHSLKDTNEQLEKQLRFQTQVRYCNFTTTDWSSGLPKKFPMGWTLNSPIWPNAD